MTADTDDSAETVGEDLDAERTTAPMSEFGRTELAYGFVVLAIGIAVAFGVPVLATAL
ncbi:hypothetical protein [Halovivax sp.]|uniref:DUF7550 family protein n=1 Tax=Halovivax sp. TaxID=1935978 RepID=UPI0025C2AC7D|nr:hypothetical protein [Halovivax sp.]